MAYNVGVNIVLPFHHPALTYLLSLKAFRKTAVTVIGYGFGSPLLDGSLVSSSHLSKLFRRVRILASLSQFESIAGKVIELFRGDKVIFFVRVVDVFPVPGHDAKAVAF